MTPGPALSLAKALRSPVRTRILLATRNSYSTSVQPSDDKVEAPRSPSSRSDQETAGEELSGSAKLFKDAIAEEVELKKRGVTAKPSVEVDDSPVWTGDESVRDAVIRMLMDANKPLRSTFRTPETKLKELSSKTSLIPIHILPSESPDHFQMSEAIRKEQEIAAEDFMPWHAKYVRNDTSAVAPQIFYGRFLQSGSSGVTSLLDRPALPNDPKERGREKARRRTEERLIRVEGARDGALDYRLGGGDGWQQKGSSAAGGGVRGGPSGMRAWQNLVEDRIERARSSGWFDNIPGRGKPIVADTDENNPHLDRTEFFMNRLVKRQGAKPPWIELLGELESAQQAFRSSLVSSYSRALLRDLITSPFHTRESLARLTVEKLEGMRLKEWEARESSYHTEAVRELNNVLRRMNAISPPVVRRPLILLSNELSYAYGAAAPKVFSDLGERLAEGWDNQRAPSLGDDDRWGGGVRDFRDTGGGTARWDWGAIDLGIMDALRRIFKMRREDKQQSR